MSEYPLVVPARNWAEWDVLSKYRCVHRKYYDVLKPLLPMYERKINALWQYLEERRETLMGYGLDKVQFEKVSEFKTVLQKIRRLEDKYYTVKQELAGRDLGHFKRKELYGTTYFQDPVDGNDANTGLSIAQAWLTVAKYTSVTVRTAGDILKVRANKTETIAAIVNFDEDGTKNALTEIRGCSIADDPWSDGSDVKPIFDMNGGAFYFNAVADSL